MLSAPIVHVNCNGQSLGWNANLLELKLTKKKTKCKMSRSSSLLCLEQLLARQVHTQSLAGKFSSFSTGTLQAKPGVKDGLDTALRRASQEMPREAEWNGREAEQGPRVRTPFPVGFGSHGGER